MARSRQVREREKHWVYQPYGDSETNPAIWNCPVFITGNTQVWLPVIVSEMFGPADSWSPTASGTNPEQEKILVKRTVGHITLTSFQLTAPDPARVPAQLRAVLCRMDEGGIWDGTHIHPSLYSVGFHADERVLRTLDPVYRGFSAISYTDELEISGTHHATIDWDQALNTSVHTGDTIWLLIEQATCTATNINRDIGWYYSGWSRALYFE